ncbi:type II secretion system protein [Ruficoccus amylovorans]|uniref:Type II secretion system protein n=1 Tax=Ruficoccus amylovorans TaxID=1804625 RepID=A0A842HGA1_9BACT|nr:type II secretion system protein [Ruficoccus amylovorans]MBC2595442.1 type II secretion system protein [Ruficoccus amylovorans]
MKLPHYTRPPSGFTLIELLTVIAVVAVLCAILIPVVGTMRYRANASKGVQNLRSIGTAMSLYVAENNGMYPEASITPETWNERYPDRPVSGSQMWTKLLREYLPQQTSSLTGRENKAFVCPNAHYVQNNRVLSMDEIARTYTATETLYGQSPEGTWNKEYRRSAMSIVHPGKTLLVVDGKAYNGSNGSLSVLLTSRMRLDQAVSGPEETTYMDFRQPDQTANVLYVDGHVSQLTFPEFQDVTTEQWNGRD